MWTTGDSSEIGGVAPASFVAGSHGAVNYHFTIARDLVRLIRDNTLPIIFVEIEPDVPHTYRLELYSDELYVWTIDGEIIDQGVPEGVYPSWTPVLQIRSKSWFLESTTYWDYIRYGRIPLDASGDFDRDFDVDEDDLFYFDECLENSGPGVDAGPGCRFGDFDFDGDVDCIDGLVFTDLCGCPVGPFGAAIDADLNDDGTVDFDDIVCMLDGFAGAIEPCGPQSLDIFPCTPNGTIDFDDVLATLNAFAGAPACCGAPPTDGGD